MIIIITHVARVVRRCDTCFVLKFSDIDSDFRKVFVDKIYVRRTVCGYNTPFSIVVVTLFFFF